MASKFSTFGDVKLTDRQVRKLRQMRREEGSCSTGTAMELSLLRQLEKRGLVYTIGNTYDRHEWGKLVARVPIGHLTPEGRKLADVLLRYHQINNVWILKS